MVAPVFVRVEDPSVRLALELPADLDVLSFWDQRQKPVVGLLLVVAHNQSIPLLHQSLLMLKQHLYLLLLRAEVVHLAPTVVV